MAEAKPQPLSSYLSGHTGKVTFVSAVQGTMVSKSLNVMFTRDVVTLPKTNAPPHDLTTCVAVGDSLHYDAILTTSPVPPHQAMYLATKAWFPKTKQKQQAPTAAATSPAPHIESAVNAKLVVKVIKALLKKDGPMNVDHMLDLFANASVEVRSVYGNTAQGLKKFVAERPKKFTLTNDLVRVAEKPKQTAAKKSNANGAETQPQKPSKQLVKKSVGTVKNLLRPHGSMPVQKLQQLFGLVSKCEPAVRHFVGLSEECFQAFLAAHPADFRLLPNGVVTCNDVSKPKATAGKAATNSEQTNGGEAMAAEQEIAVANYLKGLLERGGPATVSSLTVFLSESHHFIPPGGLKSFVKRHPATFVLQDGCVHLASSVAQQATAPKKVAPEDNCDLVVQSVDYLKGVLDLKGPLPIKKLLGHLSSTTPEVRKFIGNAPMAIGTFLKSHGDVFVVSKSNVVYRADRMERVVAGAPGEEKPSPVYHRGIVLHVQNKFGFVQRGTVDYENIFFDLTSYVQVEQVSKVDDLKNVVSIGDMVDCLFIPSSKDNRCKYRAVTVWKVTLTENNASVVSLVSTLQSPALYGEVKITFLDADVGYCMAEGSDSESLIEFEGKFKVKPALVTFHMKYVSYPKDLCNLLKMGSRVKFVARWTSSNKESGVEYWNAVSMWPSSGLKPRHEDVPKAGLHLTTAQIREMTNEGGELSFGYDPWAHRVAFNWEYLLGNSVFNRVVAVRVGDKYWCVVKNRGTMGNTKWVASKMRPCEDDNSSKPPSNYSCYSSIPATDVFPLDGQRSVGDAVATPPDSAQSTKATSKKLPPKSADHGSKPSLQRQVSDAASSTSDGSSGSEESASSGTDPLLAMLMGPQRPFEPPMTFQELSILDYTPMSEGTSGGRKTPDVVDGNGTLVFKDPYGGRLETEAKDVVYFSAHSFYLNGEPVTHYLFSENTSVHFDATRRGNDTLVATKVWIGKKPN